MCGVFVATALEAQAGPKKPPTPGKNPPVAEAPAAQAPSTQKEDKSLDLDTVVVTAEKVEKNEMKVPASLSVVRAADIEKRQIRTLDDLRQSVPGVGTVGVAGYYNPFMIRNIGGDFINYYNTPVAFYVDNVPYLNMAAYPQNLWQVESLEVLRGPHGTLYGRGALAGVINIKTKDPSNKVEHYGITDYTNYNDARLNEIRTAQGISFPLIQDKLFLRVAGFYNYGNGYIWNQTLDKADPETKSGGGSLKIVAKPTKDLKISGLVNASIGKQALPPFATDVASRKVERNRVGDYGTQNLTSALDIALDLNKISLASITTLNRYKLDVTNQDLDHLAADINYASTNQDHTTGTQEIRIKSGKYSIPISFVSGIFGSYSKFQDNLDYSFFGSPLVSRSDVKIANVALFGQASFDFLGFEKNAHSLELIAGGRFDHEQVTATGYGFGNVNYDVNGKYEAFSPKVALQYGYEESLTVFAGASRGFRAGGANSFPTNSSNAQYNPEYLWSYEVGTKIFVFDRRVKSSLTGFYLDNKDVQINVYTLSGSSYTQVITNGGTAKSFGAEWEVAVRPFKGEKYLKGILFEGNLAYNPIRFGTYKTATSTGAPVDNSGNRLPAASDFTSFVAIEYSFPASLFGKEINPFARGDYSYRSGFFSEVHNPAEFFQQGYGLWGAQIGFRSENIDFMLWGKNLTNENYFTYGSGYLKDFGTPAIYSLGRPRSFGFTLTSRF